MKNNSYSFEKRNEVKLFLLKLGLEPFPLILYLACIAISANETSPSHRSTPISDRSSATTTTSATTWADETTFQTIFAFYGLVCETWQQKRTKNR